jgi:site-specific recombinase XerD
VAGKWKRSSVSFHVQSLRSFFRYASSRGWCAAGIAESIDAPRLYTYENLPRGPSWEDVKKLLASVTEAALPASLGRRSFHDDSEATEEVGPEA